MPPHALWAEPAATLGTILDSSDTAIIELDEDVIHDEGQGAAPSR